MSEVVGVGVLAISTVVPVLIARTVLGVMVSTLRHRPQAAPARSDAQQS